jgi:hypothetical protein
MLGRWDRRRLCVGGRANCKRKDADRLGDVLELGWAEVCDREIKPPFHLTIGVLGEADRAGLGYAFQPRGDIDAIAHQIAVGFLDDVAQMNADAELDAPFRPDACIALGSSGLYLDRAARSVDHAAKFDKEAVPVRLTMRP